MLFTPFKKLINFIIMYIAIVFAINGFDALLIIDRFSGREHV